jgi:DNA-binding transcriptional LysR family regulator
VFETNTFGVMAMTQALRPQLRARRSWVPRLAAMCVRGPKLGEFARTYPGVVLDVSTDETRLDLVAGGFDAGVQYGEFIQHDMVAVRVSPDHRPAIVGAPAYFKDHPRPTSPHDLLQHRCVNYRHGSGELYRWELDKGDQSVVVAVNGPLITNDIDLLTRAAIDGVGLAFMSEEQAAPHLANGALVRVLEDWCPPFPGFFLYYPSRRQHPAALTALIETLRV